MLLFHDTGSPTLTKSLVIWVVWWSFIWEFICLPILFTTASLQGLWRKGTHAIRRERRFPVISSSSRISAHFFIPQANIWYLMPAGRGGSLMNYWVLGPPSSSCILWLLLGTSLSYSFSWACFDFLLFYSSLDQILSLFLNFGIS